MDTTTKTPTTPTIPTIILVPGHWLGAWAWDDVRAHLSAAGMVTVALTLPGLDPDDPARATRTLDEQVAAVEAAVDAAAGDVVLVAHSGANAPVSIVLDRHPSAIRRVVWVDSGPLAAGSVLDPGLPDDVDDLPLPAFDLLGAQASTEGLDAAQLDRFRERAVPQPASVLRAPVHLDDDRRLGVPTTLVCCSMPGVQVLELASGGHPMFAEVARLRDVDVVDLPTGHWPMWSRSGDLADVIRTAVGRCC